MGKIISLSEDIVNKIAAGEVIERPASVVKELVENAIDAGATAIDVDIKKAGKELIRVKDNGCGMSSEDALLCVQRHTTSKIRQAGDLFNIRTLGFRGEALASIAAVSHFVLTTKEKGEVAGTRVTVSGGVLQRNEEVGSPEGTTIDVHELFFNTPARRKFMKSDGTEAAQILDIVTRYALFYSTVSFRVVNDGKIILSTEKTDDVKQTIAKVYGAAIAKELLPVNKDTEAIRVQGLVSKPTITRSDKDHQTFFVNGRLVKSPLIEHALHEAYHAVLFIHRHPFALLRIDVDPSMIDVNVHPTKKEIKFEKSDVVYRFVYHAVRDVLEKENLIPAVEMQAMQEQMQLTKGFDRRFETSTQAVLSSNVPMMQRSAVLVERSHIPALRLLGQVHNTFFIAETAEGLLIIDQHIVQERVLYEQFMHDYMKKAVKPQMMLEPVIVELSAADALFVSEQIDELAELGFFVEAFGGNSVRVRSVPSIFGRLQPSDVLPDVLGQLREGKTTAVLNKAESVITRMACRASIKAGDVCTIPQMYTLLGQLEHCTLPFHCPHGRPVFINVTREELERMFLRG
ncbi:MAG TPA: DNA mismatch repair endonuclease MutL [Candidatus Nanoarchaeia archaeon]|nr:DNA mismatch repair endonuclease MutL [Candidatus Nanoarchaeia archaeon]